MGRVSKNKTETPPLSVEKVIFSDNATIVLWNDGTKSVVKCDKWDKYDWEKGLAMAMAKKVLGNSGNYYNTFKKWQPEGEFYSSFLHPPTRKDIIEKHTIEVFRKLDDPILSAPQISDIINEVQEVTT